MQRNLSTWWDSKDKEFLLSSFPSPPLWQKLLLHEHSINADSNNLIAYVRTYTLQVVCSNSAWNICMFSSVQCYGCGFGHSPTMSTNICKDPLCEDWFCAALCRRETRNFNAADFLETAISLPNQEISYLYQEKYQHPVHICKRWDWAPPTQPDKTSQNFETTFLWTLIILLPWCVLVSLPCVLYFWFRNWSVL